MTPAERILAAMNLRKPDRVPVMCQLSLGHYLLNLGLAPADFWVHNETLVDAYVTLAERYGFDGILVNLPGRSPQADAWVAEVEDTRDSEIIHWTDGTRAICPRDDLPYQVSARARVPIEEIEPDKVFYEDPHTLGGLKYPFYYDLEPYDWSGEDIFPPYINAIIDGVIARVGGRLSVHSEVFSPFTQLMERLGYEQGLMALITEREKCQALLGRFAEGAGALARLQASRGVDAVLISSAFAGGGFISRIMYEEFVLPWESRVVEAIHEGGAKAYTHTCGAIGDRLELMAASGIDGIDTMDPPPLGDTGLADAKARVGGRLFLKGNVDSVNILLNGSVSRCREDAREKLGAAMAGGGYILSSACSVAPRVPPENILALVEVAEQEGGYDR